MKPVDKVNPVVLLLVLQGSFAASQLSGVAQPFETVPFVWTSKVMHTAAPLLCEDESDRQALCQAFAGRMALLVAIVVPGEQSRQEVIRSFIENDEPTASLFGEDLSMRRTELVVPIDTDETDNCEKLFRLVGNNMMLPGVPQGILWDKMNVIIGQVRCYRTYLALSREEVAHQYA